MYVVFNRKDWEEEEGFTFPSKQIFISFVINIQKLKFIFGIFAFFNVWLSIQTT
jgi:hypothetical protein